MSIDISVAIKDPRAVFPTKAHSDDVGYDLTLIDVAKVIDDETTMYETGIAVAPGSDGYYVEIVPRSSFSKSGYVLANSVGIIDPQYRGTLKVVLVRVDKTKPQISLPYKGFQMIVRENIKSRLILKDNLDETERGDGGFGSTDVKK
jgi:dUTP pyrophosphatase